MSEPIVWDEHEQATVDGVKVQAFPNGGKGRVISVSPDPYVSIHERRDHAARAVVAAVKVLRGER